MRAADLDRQARVVGDLEVPFECREIVARGGERDARVHADRRIVQAPSQPQRMIGPLDGLADPDG